MSRRMVSIVATLVSFLTSLWAPPMLNSHAEVSGHLYSAHAATPGPLKAGWKLAAPISFQNLTIFPVTAVVWPSVDQFITLDTGLKSGRVKVTEMGADDSGQPGAQNQQSRTGAQVNQLAVRNDSGKMLLLLAGELLLGGQQDRIDATDRIVPSSDQSSTLAVFCVEPHRWTGTQDIGFIASDRGGDTATGAGTGRGYNMGGGTPEFGGRTSTVARLSSGTSGGSGIGTGAGAGVGTNAEGSVSVGARVTEAVTVVGSGSAGIANSSVRERAEVSGDQLQVWAGVARTLRSVNAVTKSGSLQRGYDNQNVTSRLNMYSRAFKATPRPNVVGAVVAIDGKVQLADVFASPSLFRQYWPKLLKSYELEAISSGHRRAVVVPAERAKRFLSPVINGEISTQGEDGSYKLTRRSAGRESSFELEFTGGPAPVLIHFNRISSKSVTHS
jgi:hypothetical protein